MTGNNMDNFTDDASPKAGVPTGKSGVGLVPLAECPVGLFIAGGELCLKTEYGTNEGRIDAFIVSSGEFFWGGHPQTIENQRAQMVRPVECVAYVDKDTSP